MLQHPHQLVMVGGCNKCAVNEDCHRQIHIFPLRPRASTYILLVLIFFSMLLCIHLHIYYFLWSVPLPVPPCAPTYYWPWYFPICPSAPIFFELKGRVSLNFFYSFISPVGYNIWWENSRNKSFRPKNGPKMQISSFLRSILGSKFGTIPSGGGQN